MFNQHGLVQGQSNSSQNAGFTFNVNDLCNRFMDQINKLQDENRKLTKQNPTLADDNAELKIKVSNLEKVNVELNRQIAELKNSINNQSISYKTLETVHNKLKEELGSKSSTAKPPAAKPPLKSDGEFGNTSSGGGLLASSTPGLSPAPQSPATPQPPGQTSKSGLLGVIQPQLLADKPGQSSPAAKKSPLFSSIDLNPFMNPQQKPPSWLTASPPKDPEGKNTLQTEIDDAQQTTEAKESGQPGLHPFKILTLAEAKQMHSTSGTNPNCPTTPSESDLKLSPTMLSPN